MHLFYLLPTDLRYVTMQALFCTVLRLLPRMAFSLLSDGARGWMLLPVCLEQQQAGADCFNDGSFPPQEKEKEKVGHGRGRGRERGELCLQYLECTVVLVRDVM